MSNAVSKIEPRDVISTAPAPVPAMSESAAILQIIERAAANPNVDIEKMERLFEMRERFEQAASKKAYQAAFAQMQPDLPVIDRNGRIVIEKNGSVIQSTAFADIADINEAVMPILGKHGFGLSHRSGQSADGKLTVTGILSHKDGHSEETTMTLQHDSTGSKNSVQAIGSSMTYGRRYTTLMLLNITSRARQDRDDDGKAAGIGATLSDDQLEKLRTELFSKKADEDRFKKFFGIEILADMPAKRFDEAMAMLRQKKVNTNA